jgi:prevent-host-death family protein
MDKYISATDAARNFSELLNKVSYRGDTYIIERGGKPVGRLEPVGPSFRRKGRELAAVWRTMPHVGPTFADGLEAVVHSQDVSVPSSPWDDE